MEACALRKLLNRAPEHCLRLIQENDLVLGSSVGEVGCRANGSKGQNDPNNGVRKMSS